MNYRDDELITDPTGIRLSRGSEWRKWDLHLHTPLTKKNDNYRLSKGKDAWDEFCEIIENSDVEAIGITDYFSFDGYFTFIDKYTAKYPDSTKVFFPNVELALNESVNPIQEEVNVHLIFRPEITKQEAKKFLSNLKTLKTDENGRKISCDQLIREGARNDFEGATVTRENITKAIKEVYGERIVRQDYVLILAAVNNDGARPQRGKKRKEIITDEIDKFCDAFFGGSQNTTHFLKTDRLEDKGQRIKEKPVLSGCDAHSFEDLHRWLGKVVHEDSTSKEITWIKADLTYEGLLQILIEPEERVNIAATKPDEKEAYKVIDNVVFAGTSDFPAQIKFNSNLCSIIGSRSSGKSALLNYIAHAVDPSEVEAQLHGPAAKIHWQGLPLKCTVYWANGSEDDSGKIVFLHQGYLSGISDKPEEITEKIKPVLFRKFPTIEAEYKATLNTIASCNKAIELAVQRWFSTMRAIDTLHKDIKAVGEKVSITAAKNEYQKKIDEIKTTLSLSDKDVKDYQKISADLTAHEEQIKILISLKNDLTTEYFDPISKEVIDLNLDFTFNPSLDNLPRELMSQIESDITETANKMVQETKTSIITYKSQLVSKIKAASDEIDRLKNDNRGLIDKNKKNEELAKFVAELNKQESKLTLIRGQEDSIKILQDKTEVDMKSILSNLTSREKALGDLESSLTNLDQSKNTMQFGIESSFSDPSIAHLSERYNLREVKNNEFIKDGFIDIAKARNQYQKLLSDLSSEKIVLKNHEDPQAVAIQTLSFSEDIRFTAVMEGDSIGGFSESSMTPGKQALFALTLILDESDDAWPLLIDQPEDDLDSRSIYDQIARYFKDKKKERQIIMVSHNANLVVGADSEQIIVANKHGDDRKNRDGAMFNYMTGSLEHTFPRDNSNRFVLESCGIREHACDILDGGEIAFQKRKHKYNI